MIGRAGAFNFKTIFCQVTSVYKKDFLLMEDLSLYMASHAISYLTTLGHLYSNII